ncbi:Protein FRA10AC1 [Aphelenchoides besseyi]|nr:Protein FRA10AC1 [Aphelenchoides besseyi]
MIKRVYDEPNPFAPEIKRSRKSEQKSEIKKFKKHFISLDAYERHKQLINNYQLYYPGSTKTLERDTSKHKGIFDIIQVPFTQLTSKTIDFYGGTDDLSDSAKSWDMQLAKRYYDKLFKEYCIADLTHFQKNRIGMRWRTEEEVKKGKGQFECGSKHCNVRKKLTTWEVNFSYVEHGEHKNALVKLRLCKECSMKLNFYSQKKKIKKREESIEETQTRKTKKRSENIANIMILIRVPAAQHPQEVQKSTASEPVASTSHQASTTSEVDEKTKEKEDAEKAEKEARDIWTKQADMPTEEVQTQDEIDAFLDDFSFRLAMLTVSGTATLDLRPLEPAL